MLTLTGLGRRRRRRDLSEQHEQVLRQLTNRPAISNSSLPPIFPLHLHSADENTETMSRFNSSTFNPFEKHFNASDPNVSSFSKEMPIFGEMDEADKKVTVCVHCQMNLELLKINSIVPFSESNIRAFPAGRCAAVPASVRPA